MDRRNGGLMRRLAMKAAGVGLLAASSATLAQAGHDVKIAGLGTARCSEWTAWKTEGNAERRATALQWVFGFVGGHNIYSLSAHRNPTSLNPQANTLETLIDGHCDVNPSSRLVEAAVATITGLGGASTSIKPPAAKGRPLPAAPAVRQQAL